MDLALLEERPVILDGSPHQIGQVERRALQPDLVPRDAGHVEKIVEQTGQVPDLAIDDGLRPARLLSTRDCPIKDE